MKIDNTPAVRAFCNARIDSLKEQNAHTTDQTGKEVIAARIDELNLIITLCDGLIQQQELLSKALKVWTPPS
jgi:protein-tyrosine-phosphatase